MTIEENRKQPNILITGTPGTGKTTTSELVALACGMRHVNVGALVKEHALHEGFDEHYGSFVLDEDKVILCNLERVISFGQELISFTAVRSPGAGDYERRRGAGLSLVRSVPGGLVRSDCGSARGQYDFV